MTFGSRRVIDWNFTIAFAVVSVILLGAFIVTGLNYMAASAKNQEYISYVSNHSHSDTEYYSLNQTLNELNASYNALNKEYQDYISDRGINVAALNKSIQDLVAPNLIKIDIQYSDSNLFVFGSIRITGYICNTGKNTAYNCRLIVDAYHGSSKAIDNYQIILGKGIINGQNWVKTDSTISYFGKSVTSIIITPQWTTR